jgi:transposase-like protein
MNKEIAMTAPKTLQQAIIYFADADRALEYMKPLVWPDGIMCPHCQSKEKQYFFAKRRVWKCSVCKQQFSIKIGTVMEDSPLGLDKWLAAMWLIVNAKNGISSYEIHRALGVTQKSAWFLLHRIRLAMQTGSFKKMSGTVEIDEAYLGGKLRNMKKSKLAEIRKAAQKPNGQRPALGGSIGKAIVVGLLERGQDGKPSQVRTTTVATPKRPHIQDVVRQNVEPSSIAMTDALGSYKGLQADYIHMAVNRAICYAKGRIHTNGLENFWSLLSRTIQGTYIACEPFHLMRYLDEQCFRFNNRKMNDSERLATVMAMVGGKRLTYAELTGKVTRQEYTGLPS